MYNKQHLFKKPSVLTDTNCYVTLQYDVHFLCIVTASSNPEHNIYCFKDILELE
jgi:hypothetical protein